MKSQAVPSSICKGSQKSCGADALLLTSINNCNPYLLSLQCLTLKGIITQSIGILIQFLTTPQQPGKILTSNNKLQSYA